MSSLTSSESYPRYLPLFLAMAAGATVANLYYHQPLLTVMAHDLNVGDTALGTVPTATQMGYATGLLLIVPMGDRVERRRLIVIMTLLVGLMMVLVSMAQSVLQIVAMSYALGLCCVGIQVVVPYAASLNEDPVARGKMVGTVMSGVLIGVLASRTVSGLLVPYLGWRGVYRMAGLLMLVTGVTLVKALKQQRPSSAPAYRALLASLVPLWTKESVLRRHSVVGACGFAAFSCFWSTLVFYVSGHPFDGGPELAGSLGLCGVVGALAATAVGRLSGRVSAPVLNGTLLGTILVSFIWFAFLGQTLVGLIVGIILMDLGVQGSHIGNQTRVFALNPQFRNRLNAVYMVCYFLGGAMGSATGTWAWQHHGWHGVTTAGALWALAGEAALFLL